MAEARFLFGVGGKRSQAKMGLEFVDDLLSGDFRDQVAFDLEIERLLEWPPSLISANDA